MTHDAADSKIGTKFGQARRPPTGRAAFAGLVIVGLLFGGLFSWAWYAPLESAAVANGSVVLDTNRKTVQHLEGGIVRKILVREGQAVSPGQPLILLDTTQPQALTKLLKARIRSANRQLHYLRKEIATVEAMLRRGLALKPRLFGLYRRQAQLEGERETQEARLATAMDMIRRSTIRAPIAGRVVELKVHTPGGIIKAGEPLLSIVPRDEPLVVEAHINPDDIDVVRRGLRAMVHLTPYNARWSVPLEGKVIWISADRMTDERSGAKYYLARIGVKAAPRAARRQSLYPGMPVEVVVVTGKRTVFDYLTAPLTRSFRRAFREE